MTAAPNPARPAPSPLARAIRAVLLHPAAMAVKQRLKDGLWRLKGRALVNPPLLLPVRSMVFVCLGNICRSPFAEHLARRQFVEAGCGDIRCVSAGLHTRQAGRAPASAVAVAADRYGLALDAHRPQMLTPEMAGEHDLIIVMEASQLEQVRATYPALAPRTVLLSLYDPVPAGAYERYNIEDPFGQSRATFERCYERIDRALGALVGSICRAPTQPCA